MAEKSFKYLHLYPGQGDVWEFPLTIKFNNSTEQVVNAVGTSSCITTVGVYIPMDDELKKCFVAHIVAIVEGAGGLKAWCPGASYPEENLVNDALKDAIITALKDDQGIKQHYQKEAKAARKKHGIIVCPVGTLGKAGGETDGSGDFYTTGHDIMRAVREFFEVPNLTITAGHGFGRQSGNDGEVCLFGWKDGEMKSTIDFRSMLDGKARPAEKKPGDYGWEPCNEDERGKNSARAIKQFAEVPKGSWSFVYRDGKWQRNVPAASEDQGGQRVKSIAVDNEFSR